MLESKRLAGRVRVEAGNSLSAGTRIRRTGTRTRASPAAPGAQRSICTHASSSPVRAVQAVVVLWADFDQRSIERDKVAWVRGDQLATVLADRPIKYSGTAVEQLTAATRKAVTMLRPDPETRVGPQ
jgi:hypothetical protein